MIGVALPPALAAGADSVKVNVKFNMQMPQSDLSEEAVAEAQTTARTALYNRIGNECRILQATIAETCRLTQLHVNTQTRAQHNKGLPTLYINAGANFVITLKPKAAE